MASLRVWKKTLRTDGAEAGSLRSSIFSTHGQLARWSRLARDPASQASLDKLGAVRALLRVLREAGADEAVTTLAGRAAARAGLDDPEAVAWLLNELRAGGAEESVVITLAGRAAGQASLDDPEAVAELLRALHNAGVNEAVITLLARDPAARPGSTTRRPSPSCFTCWTRPERTRPSPPWPAGPPMQACSVFSVSSGLARPSATYSAVIQTERRRDPGDGKNQANQDPGSADEAAGRSSRP